jgi:hypothetical protein
MKKDMGYAIRFNVHMTRFRFTSTGPKGDIEKIIEYRKFQKKRWNLAFGDVQENDWTDNIISDNDDMRIILQTVANTVHLFIETHPDQEVFIEPLDRQRKILYNRIFQQKWVEIDALFSVKGKIGVNDFEDYTPQKVFDFFVITQKENIFQE